MDVQKNIESIVEKRSREIFGAPPGKKLIVFIDDMNMPLVDIYGTQQPIAFLKLLFERGGFYDRGRDLNWKYLKDICKYRIQNIPKITISKVRLLKL